MEMGNKDALGNEIGKEYTRILTDPDFEKRLTRFDPHLKLTFDQVKKRWVILEWVPAYGHFNILLTAEDEVTKEPKPLGDWIFNQLFVWRMNALEKQKNFAAWWDKQRYEEQQQQCIIDAANSREHRGILMDERNQWRKAYRELNNLPVSDVTAGYPKRKPFMEAIFPKDTHLPDVVQDDELKQFQASGAEIIT